MLSVLWLLAALRGPAGDSLMVPGVSHELARYRAARISDVRYDLDLDVRRRDVARGRVTIAFTRRGGGDVYVDFRGRAFDDVRVNGKPTTTVEYNGTHLRFGGAALRDGPNVIAMHFEAPIARAGASVIRFTDETDRREYLYTLLVPSDANLLFPCFDQPDLKAVFRLGVRVPDTSWHVLSNAPANGVTPIAGGGLLHEFRPTRPIPTYLFAFAAGPFARLRSRGLSGTLWVRASRAKEVDADTLIAYNQRAKRWLERYFGVPYPWADSARGKDVDFLLAPAFPFGGMEHPGAIFYNEESFIFREPPTLTQKIGRQATIYHEVAHQWFGDYTTMRWFDDLWMKEGFATYMAAKMQAATGDTTAWMSFYLRNKPAAYDVDASAGTTPVWQELANLDQAKSNYGAIVYNKAPGVLKQLEHLVGEQAFRRGVHDFLVAHAYGNATWRELLASVGRASGRNLDAWGRMYFLRPGMPVIEQQLQVSDGWIGRLALVQHPARPLSGAGVWPMKIDVRVDYGEDSSVVIPVELRAESTTVAAARGLPAPRFVYANAKDFGYGLFMLDARSRDWLLESRGGTPGVAGVRDPLLRAMLWGSLWDLVRDARLDPSRYVDAALAALPSESDEQIASRLLARVSRAVDTYLAPNGESPVHPGYSVLCRRVEDVFLRGASDTSRGYGMRKSYVDAYIGIAHSTPALARLDAWLDSASAAGIALRQPTRWSIVTALIARGARSAEARLAAEIVRDTTTGGKRRTFIAGAAFPRAENKRTYFTRYFADSTLNEEWVMASLGAFNAGEQASLTLPYLRPALDSLPWIRRNRRIFFLGRWLDAFIDGQRSPDALGLVDLYLAEHPRLPRDLRQKVLQSRDDLERTVRIRQAFMR